MKENIIKFLKAKVVPLTVDDINQLIGAVSQLEDKKPEVTNPKKK
jgi:hypothetical protein